VMVLVASPHGGLALVGTHPHPMEEGHKVDQEEAPEGPLSTGVLRTLDP
jgi:hypothetical protein